MRVFIGLLSFLLIISVDVLAQKGCDSYQYTAASVRSHPGLQASFNSVEQFVREHALTSRTQGSRGPESVITIPVVVHILYHDISQNITDQQVINQVNALNINFRRLNPDTVNTPERFRARASDPGFEFKLAISDPAMRATSGIIRKYTPVIAWTLDDQVKSSARTGDDAWDSGKYLNIWVCNLGRTAGYATFPGTDAAVDGVVLNFSAFGYNPGTVYDMGKTGVHEVGHWLGLKHIWGDEYCGDDGVADTPPQSNFTISCPASGFAPACDNSADGAMYMNYMDLSIDACTNLFTEGQSLRMRSIFDLGGARASIIHSHGLLPPLFNEIPVADDQPKWFYPNLYPNPARGELNVDVSNDIRWIGNLLSITNAQGQIVDRATITSKLTRIDVSRLKPGYYFMSGKKDDGAMISIKFIKL